MRKNLDFYDFLLRSVALFFLTLTVPLLPHWLQFSPQRKVVVGTICLVGFLSLWVAYHRPALFRDNIGERTDLFDWLMAGAGWFCAAATYRNAVRWWQTGQLTIHRSAVVAALAALAVFPFYCFAQRRGLKAFAGMCFLLAACGFMVGLWQLVTGSASPMHFDMLVTIETAYRWIFSGLAFTGLGIIADARDRRREKPV